MTRKKFLTGMAIATASCMLPEDLPAHLALLLDCTPSVADWLDFTRAVKSLRKLPRCSRFVLIPILDGAAASADHLFAGEMSCTRQAFDEDLRRSLASATDQVRQWRARAARATHTDIRGALEVASQELRGSGADVKVIAMLSDMMQTAAHAPLREGMEGAAVYAGLVAGPAIVKLPDGELQKLREQWKRELTGAGARLVEWRDAGLQGLEAFIEARVMQANGGRR